MGALFQDEKEEILKRDDKFRFTKAQWAHFKNVVEWPNPTAEAIPLSQLPLVIGVSERFLENQRMISLIQAALDLEIPKNTSSYFKIFEIKWINLEKEGFVIDFNDTVSLATFSLIYKNYSLFRHHEFRKLLDFIEHSNYMLRLYDLSHSPTSLNHTDLNVREYGNPLNEIIFYYSKGDEVLPIEIEVSYFSILNQCFIQTLELNNGVEMLSSESTKIVRNDDYLRIKFNIKPPNNELSEWQILNKIILSHQPIFDDFKTITSYDPNWAIFSLPIKVIDFEKKAAQIHSSLPIIVTDDCQKTRWGGKSQVNGYSILALVMIDTEGSKEVTLYISSPNAEDNQPLALFLHSTFTNQIEHLRFENGKAQLTVTAYEAFTVGAYMADGTMLELDLNRQKGYPESFYYPFVGDVLWVDDRPELYNRKIIKSLEKRGYVFYEALSTDQAIELLQNYSFDLIISDMVRGENQRAGMDLLKYLQEKQIVTPTVIYSSNYKIDDFRDEAIALGAKEVISGSRTRMTEYIEQFFSNTKA